MQKNRGSGARLLGVEGRPLGAPVEDHVDAAHNELLVDGYDRITDRKLACRESVCCGRAGRGSDDAAHARLVKVES